MRKTFPRYLPRSRPKVCESIRLAKTRKERLIGISTELVYIVTMLRWKFESHWLLKIRNRPHLVPFVNGSWSAKHPKTGINWLPHSSIPRIAKRLRCITLWPRIFCRIFGQCLCNKSSWNAESESINRDWKWFFKLMLMAFYLDLYRLICTRIFGAAIVL